MSCGEVKSVSPVAAAALLKHQQLMESRALASKVDAALAAAPQPCLGEYVRMIYDYESQSSGVTAEECIVLRQGELYRVVERSTSEWWYVESEDCTLGCYVPATFVQSLNGKELSAAVAAPLQSLAEEEKCAAVEDAQPSFLVRNIRDHFEQSISMMSARASGAGSPALSGHLTAAAAAARVASSPITVPGRPSYSSGDTTDGSCTPDFKEDVEEVQERGGGAASSDEGLLSGTDGSLEQLNSSGSFGGGNRRRQGSAGSSMDLKNAEFKQQLMKQLSVKSGTPSAGAAPRTSASKKKKSHDARQPQVLPCAAAPGDPISPPPPQSLPPHGRPEISAPIVNLQGTRKQGFLLATKFAQDGKKLKKRWTPYWAVLSGPTLYLFKDRSHALSKTGTAQEVLELAQMRVLPPEDGVTKRKNVLKLVTEGDTAWLLQSEKRCKEWELAFTMSKDMAVRQLYKSRAVPLASPTHQAIRHNAFGPKRGVGKILNDFFKRRPLAETLQAKGILRNEPVFGSTLALIVEQEAGVARGDSASPDVPLFVQRCIDAVEKREGLLLEGIYRVAGNTATVQRLRCKVDQTCSYDLEEAQWEVHVLTAALKTFFRELKEPLLPCDQYDRLMTAYHNGGVKSKSKVDAVRSILHGLPRVNYRTMETLFKHLYRVLEQSTVNQMMSHNLATMFGPNLMWSEQSSLDLTTSLLLQNQVTDFLLVETPRIFVQ